MLDTITPQHKLISYLNLYDSSMQPIMDPCFSEYLIKFACGHEKTIFKDSYGMADQFCEKCQAMRDVSKFEFNGVKPESIDQERQDFVRIDIERWNVEDKEGRYVMKRKHENTNGKYIARLDYWAMPNYGQFSKEEIEAKKEKNLEMPTAIYKDRLAITVFEVPQTDLYDPNLVALLKKYLSVPDTRAFEMINKGRRGDGTFIYERGMPINGPALTTKV